MSKLSMLIFLVVRSISLCLDDPLVNNLQAENLPSFNEQLIAENEALEEQVRSLNELRKSEQFEKRSYSDVFNSENVIMFSIVVVVAGGVSYYFFCQYDANFFSNLEGANMDMINKMSDLKRNLSHLKTRLERNGDNLEAIMETLGMDEE